MQEQPPIPIPWKQRWRRFRHRGLPPLCFLTSVVLSGWLWQQQGALPNAVGEVEAIRVQVNTQSEGQLIPLANRTGGQWELFDRVEAGQLVATLDNRAIATSLEAFAQRTASLSRQLQLTADQMQTTEMAPSESETLGHVLEIELLQLATLQHEAELARDQLQLASLQLPDLAAVTQWNKERASTQPVESESVRQERLENQIIQHQRAVEGSRTEQLQLAERYGNSPGFAELRGQLLAPLQLAITDALVNSEKFRQRVLALEVRSPIAGTIMKIHHWRGENVSVGEAVVTIAADQSRHVVSYVLENRGILPEKGTLVTLRPRVPSATRVISVVEVVGPQVERVPAHVASDPQRDEWGVPVRIKLPPDLSVQPGALLDITFEGSSADRL